MRYAVCGKKATYHFCVSTIPSVRFLLHCRIRYTVRQNELLHVAIQLANVYAYRMLHHAYRTKGILASWLFTDQREVFALAHNPTTPSTFFTLDPHASQDLSFHIPTYTLTHILTKQNERKPLYMDYIHLYFLLSFQFRLQHGMWR